ncbi:MAG: DNA translocase FtsK 4TM domain-containing protein [Anaerolineales bacterium]
MARRKKKKINIQISAKRQLDLLGWSLFFLALLTLLSLISVQRGSLTDWWVQALTTAFGWGIYLMPALLGAGGLWLILRRLGERLPIPDAEQLVGLGLGFFILLTTMHLIVHLLEPAVALDAWVDLGRGGGWIGAQLLELGLEWLGLAGIIITLLMGWVIVVTLTASISPAEAAQWIARRLKRARQTATSQGAMQIPFPDLAAEDEGESDENGDKPVEKATSATASGKKSRRSRRSKQKKGEPAINGGNGGRDDDDDDDEDDDALDVRIKTPTAGAQTWRLPVVHEMLEEGSEQYYSENLIRQQSRIIEETLVSLGAPVRVEEINHGPVVTQFGVQPLFIQRRTGKKTKVKVSKVASLADDLALALSARSIRIQAPIPGKGLVGIEVPNEETVVVSLRDVMESSQFKKTKGRLRLGLGQDVSGQAAVADLRLMPHLLIAGATGAGKSVCVNALVTAMLLQNTPNTLRLLIVDPKRVELTQYNGIPHLLSPVIVDVERVVPALRWVMREMDSRYKRFAEIGARNIEDFNRRVEKMDAQAEEPTIPYIVVLIDELADLMMQSPTETEQVICRLAQMSRATGIHLVIATQRPSVDVVTGLIKANFPARIAFAVASSVDSRVILDVPGAERLLGQGDMLFMPPDVSQPKRLQGAFVSDREMARLISYWRKAVEPGKAPQQAPIPPARGPAAALEQAALFPDFSDEVEAAAQFEDELLPSAVAIFLEENRASVSMLQRKLRIGYTRSARMVDLLTDMGVITADAEKGQSRAVNRAVAEKLLESIQPEDEEKALV